MISWLKSVFAPVATRLEHEARVAKLERSTEELRKRITELRAGQALTEKPERAERSDNNMPDDEFQNKYGKP